MKRNIINKLDMLKRITRFLVDHPITPAIARLTAAQTEVTNVITALDLGAEQQLTGTGQSMGGVDLRQSTARDLRAYLKDVCRTGRSLQDLNPGTRPTFRLPRTQAYPALLTSARAIIEAATPLTASFEGAGLPATFLDDLDALVTAFETATGQKNGGTFTQVMGTAVQKAKVAVGMLEAQKIDAIVRNVYRSEPEMLAAWASARHVRLSAQTQPEEPPAAPPLVAAAAPTDFGQPSTIGAPNATSTQVAIG